MDISHAVLTEHALEQMAKRQITAADVKYVLTASEYVFEVRTGRIVAQGMVGGYLLRVFVDVDRMPPEVVTAYRTSKIEKYRNQP
jgi:hypothetical protein